MAQRNRIWQYSYGQFVLNTESTEIQAVSLESLPGDTIGHMILSVTPSYITGESEGSDSAPFIDAFMGVYVGSLADPQPRIPQLEPDGWMLWDRINWTPTSTPLIYYNAIAEIPSRETRVAQSTGQTRFYESKGMRTVQSGWVPRVIADMGEPWSLTFEAINLTWALRYLVFTGAPS